MIYLDKNGVSIKADKKAKVGQEYMLNGVSYLVVCITSAKSELLRV